MTLIVALKGTDGIVLASDSRGTIGDPRGLTAVNDDQVKLFKLSDYCGIGISGASEIAAKIVDELLPTLRDNRTEHVNDIVDKARELVREKYDDWFSKFEVKERPGLVLTIVGFQRTEDTTDESRTYMLASNLDFAPQLFPNGNSLVGIPQYAVYLMHRLYNPEMTVDSLTRLAAYLISETATQDPKVGGPIRIAVLTPEDGFNELDRSSVEEINQQNAAQSDQLRQSFFAGDV